ncbi:tyrosine--tRNA ligase, partial [Striga asiatica]
MKSAQKLSQLKFSIISAFCTHFRVGEIYSSSSSFSFPFSDRVKIARETSSVIGDPFWNTCFDKIMQTYFIQSKKVTTYETQSSESVSSNTRRVARDSVSRAVVIKESLLIRKLEKSCGYVARLEFLWIFVFTVDSPDVVRMKTEHVFQVFADKRIPITPDFC